MQTFKIFQKGEFSENDLEHFLSISGESQSSFRYFKNRSLCAIANHVCTILYFENEIPVCYGHLDVEEENIWLGICVADDFKSKGLGKAMLERLIKEATLLNLSVIKLSVDFNNPNAITLYTKFGFETYDQYLGKYQMMQKRMDAEK